MSTLERRQTRGAVELRAAGGRKIGGYAAKFNIRSQNLGGFVERIDPKFFNSSQGNNWPGVMARYNHTGLLATTQGQSLRLSIDTTGLDYEADLLDDTFSQRVLQLVTRGDVSQSSFAFYLANEGDDWSLTEDGFPLRTLLSGSLVDVAPVDQPAYLDTSTGLRSLAEKRGMEMSEIEELARTDKLADLITKPPTVLDLGSRSAEVEGQGETRPTPRVQMLRRALEMKKPN